MRSLTAAAVALVAVLAVSGCGDDPRPAGTPAAVSPTPSAVVPNAAALGAKLVAAGVGVVAVVGQDAATDPNHLLGRPGGYSSRASFDLAGADKEGDVGAVDRGGVLEVFPTEAAARRRADYIGGIVAAAPELVSEHDFVHGPVLLRVAGAVTPDAAGRVDAALVSALAG